MRWVLLLHEDVTAAASTSHEDALAELATYDRVLAEARSAGLEVDGEVLMPPSDGFAVTVEQGEPTVGPITVGDTDVGGLLVVDGDEAAVLDLAARLPVVTHGRVEVRKVFTPPPGMLDGPA